VTAIGPSLSCLLYVSQARAGLSAADLEAILATARRINGNSGVTGALLHYGGRFMQALEGPAEAVQDTFDRICLDPRHHDVQLVTQGPTAVRHFDGWSMRHVPEPEGHDRAVTAFLDELAARPDAEHTHTALLLLERLAT
jgi:hypothetical protein